MQWADVVAAPSDKKLRQFAGLWIAFFLGLAGWRVFHGQHGAAAWTLAAVGVVVGGVGAALPAAIRPVYTAWMIAAFPIGWTVSRVMLGALFFGVFTPVAAIFRAMRRDALRLRRRSDLESYWTEQPSSDIHSYFRQF
jgi:Saxitoxin biosynthesis operon protein SxtJ